MIGKLLNNRYLIEERIGSGGMATVYKAMDQLLDRVVAIKVLNQDDLHDEDSIRKFRREARAAGSLSHYNIVGVYDVGQQDDIHYIVMELVVGKTLKEYIKQQGKLLTSDALNIAIQICDALRHAHNNGVIHRDIKPQNIILSKDKNIKVADFGIARAVSSDTLTKSKDIYGSVRYFSPEQASGDTVGVKSDMYSLGIVIYEMLSGRLPFNGDTPIAWAMKHINDDPIELSEIDPKIPKSLSDIVQKTIQKDPDDRFENIDELRDSLQKFKEGLPVEIEMVKKKQTISRHTKRSAAKKPSKVKANSKKRIITIVAVAAVLLLVGGYFGFTWIREYLDVPEITVPDVTELHLQVAKAKFEELGLKVDVVATRNHPTIAANHVISQSPVGGNKVKKGRTIEVILSEGLEFGQVPDVIGLSKNEAEVTLFNAGYLLGDIFEEHSDTVAVGDVINQNPRPGTEVKTNTAVDLVISKGKKQTNVEMPQLVGLTSQIAMQTIVDNQLAVGAITEERSTEPAGVVISQEIEKGTTVDIGTEINFVVSNGRTP